MSRPHQLAGAAVYGAHRAAGDEVVEVRIAGRVLADPDAALARLEKERASIVPTPAAPKAEPPPEEAKTLWRSILQFLTAPAKLDTENVEETVAIDVTLSTGEKRHYDVPVFDRWWSTFLGSASMLTSGVPATLPLPFVETAANATHGVVSLLATLPALATGQWALARALAYTGLKKLGLAVPSLIPVVSTIVNGTAATVDGRRALVARSRPTVGDMADLSQYARSSSG